MMGTLTIRNVPQAVILRLKESAEREGRSMEEEVRELLCERYPTRQDLLERIRGRWSKTPAPSASQVDAWIDRGLNILP